jgi:hypothetical protein
LSEFIKKNKITDESPIIEFKIINEDYFTPYRYRDDKNLPNGEFTMLNTFKNVKEALGIKDLYLNPATPTHSELSGPSSAPHSETGSGPSSAFAGSLALGLSATAGLPSANDLSASFARLTPSE